MDVKDRTARVDVLPISAPAPKEFSGSTPAPVPSTPSFSKSLQKSQPKSADAGVTPPKGPASSGESKSQFGGEPSDSLVQIPPDVIAVDQQTVGDVLPGLLPAEISTAAAAPAPSTDAAPRVDETNTAIDLAAQAGLVPIAVVPTPPPAPVKLEIPTALAAAISTNGERSAPSSSSPVSTQPSVLPRMPTGLQAGLATSTAFSESTTVESPATTVTSPVTSSVQSTSTTTAELPVDPLNAAPPIPTTPPAAVAPVIVSAVKSKPISQPPAPSGQKKDSADNNDAETSTIPLAGMEPVQSIVASSMNGSKRSKDTSQALQAAIQSTSRDTKAALPAVNTSAATSPADQADRAAVLNDERVPAGESTAWSTNTANAVGRNESVASQVPANPVPRGVVPSVVDQLQPALHRAATSSQQLSIVLRPPELGAVRIDISQQGGQLTARLEAESAAAHQLLTDQLPQLRDVLLPLGVAADQVQVVRMENTPTANWDGSGRSAGQADAGTSDRRNDTPGQHPPEPHWLEEPDRAETFTPSLRTRTAINLRI